MIASLLLLGPPGTGKTSSARTLAQKMNEQVYFINSERKDLPFPEKFKWSKRPKSTKEILDIYSQVTSQGKKMGIATVLQDSFSAYVDLALFEARALYTGYDIWSDYNNKISQLFMKQKELSDADIHSVMIAHDETIVDEGSTVIKRATRVKGKEWEAMVEKEFNIVLWTEVVPEEKDINKFQYRFMTNTNGKIVAKSPVDMFPRFIPNDLHQVLTKVNNYGNDTATAATAAEVLPDSNS